MTMVTTRRDFLKQSTAASIVGMFPMATLAGEGLYEVVGEPTPEVLYAGRPLNYWVARLNHSVDEPDFEDVDTHSAFDHFGQAAVPHLIDALDEQKAFAVSIRLASLGSPATIRLLTQALKERPRVRAGVLTTLGYIADPFFSPLPPIPDSLKDVLPVVVELLQDHDPVVRTRAETFLCWYAQQIDPSFSIPTDCLEHTDSMKGAIAVQQLGRMRPEVAIPRLVAKLQDRKAEVRWAAAEQLSRLDSDNPDIIPIFVEYLMHRGWMGDNRFSGLAGLIIKALPVLQKALESERPTVRLSDLQSLCSYNSKIER